MVTVSSNPNPTNPTNPTTKYRCELDMCCLTWYKNLGPPFTGMPNVLQLLLILHNILLIQKIISSVYLRTADIAVGVG